MDLLAAIRTDMQTITQGEFSVLINVTPPESTVSISVRGLASKFHFQINPDTGLPANSKKAYCSMSETILENAGITVRNSNGEVCLLGYKVEWVDCTGESKTYKIVENFPDETLGLIVCMLKQLEGVANPIQG